MTNKNNKSGIPDYALDSLAKFLLPAIQKYYETQEGKQAYEAWKTERKTQLNNKKSKKKSR